MYGLVENAIHQSPARGVVEVTVTAGGAGLAQLSVKDNGIGVSAKDLKHLFDTFHRSGRGRRSHAGLGAVARGEDCPPARRAGGGGEQAGRGLAPADLPADVRRRDHRPVGGGAPREGGILVVEDDVDCREVLQQVLEMEGYRVMSASSATEAQAMLETARPALVLLDLRLSEEDGMSVLHFIRQTPRLADVAVYIISGARDVASLSEGRGINRIDGFFEKPLQVPKVLDTVAAVVRPTRRLGPES